MIKWPEDCGSIFESSVHFHNRLNRLMIENPPETHLNILHNNLDTRVQRIYCNHLCILYNSLFCKCTIILLAMIDNRGVLCVASCSGVLIGVKCHFWIIHSFHLFVSSPQLYCGD